MLIRYGCEITIETQTSVPVIARVDVHPDYRKAVMKEAHEVGFTKSVDNFGNIIRRFSTNVGETCIKLDGLIYNDGQLDPRDNSARASPVLLLPDDVLPFLLGSRYCETDKMSKIAWETFGHLQPNVNMVEAICQCVHDRLKFDYQQASSTRTAWEAWQERVGVCRDFTHVAIAICRSMNIPARYVNGYLGDIGVPADPSPMDFNAWFDVYLGGKWVTFDARHNARRIGRITIARGRDACDVPMLHTFGPHILKKFKIVTEKFDEAKVAAA